MRKKAKVLYVDDEEVNLFLFQRNFQDDFDILTAESGPRGLDVLGQDETIEVVLSDMKMPMMDGVTFIQKAKESYPQKRYAIVSGYELTEEISNALQDGLISRFLKKPYTSDDIIQLISDLI